MSSWKIVLILLTTLASSGFCQGKYYHNVSCNLSLNAGKTNFMLFSNTVSQLPGDILFNNTKLVCADSTKFLGLSIDNKLTWKKHIDHRPMCKLFCRNIGVINKLKLCLPSRILLTLYSTLTFPYLNYGILARGNARKIHNNIIFLLKNRAVRIINNERFFSHTEHVFVENKILNVHDLFSSHLGILMFQLTSKRYQALLQNDLQLINTNTN